MMLQMMNFGISNDGRFGAGTKAGYNARVTERFVDGDVLVQHNNPGQATREHFQVGFLKI